jgi:hypothetical protein
LDAAGTASPREQSPRAEEGEERARTTRRPTAWGRSFGFRGDLVAHRR